MHGTDQIDPIKYGLLWGKVEAMEKRFDSMETKVSGIETKLDTLIEMANKSKGGLWLGITLVGLFSGFIGVGISILNFLKEHWK